MKKIFAAIVAVLLLLSLTACKRQNDAKNLEIYSHEGSTYVLRYCGSDLDFGNLFITIEDEKLVNFYCEYDSSVYKLQEYRLKIGDYSSALNVVDENGVATFTPQESLDFVIGEDEDGYEIISSYSIILHVSFEDIHTDEEDYTATLVDDSGISITTSPEALLIFIRNKAIKTNPASTTTES